MIENLKDLEKLMKLCRKQGIPEMTIGHISFKVGDLPGQREAEPTIEEELEDKYLNFPDGDLTNEELTFFANGGLPEDNPYRKN